MVKTFRSSNTNTRGGGFDAVTIQAVWNKARIVPGTNPTLRRKDRCGAWIDRTAYGQTNHNGTGWEIDHIHPVAAGGTDDFNNLEPLQWQNNRGKGDAWPWSGIGAVSAVN